MLLEINNLKKQYKRKNEYFNAVDYVNFSINHSEMVSIFGQSGSGKSTLLNMIVGILKPTSGSIIIDGEDISGKSNKELSLLRNEKIGYVMQGQNLLKNFTILDNICMPYYLSEKEISLDRKINFKTQKTEYKNDNEIYKGKAKKLLENVGLQGVEEAYPYELSGGELRRVSITRALIHSPRILIADEPTSNLDDKNAIKIMKIFQKISNDGVAVLVSTHDYDFIQYSDRTYCMNQGKLTKYLPNKIANGVVANI